MNTPGIRWSLLLACILVLARADAACAAVGYVGPAGIGALGVLLAVAAVLLIGAVGLVLHPVRLLLRRRRRLREEHADAAPDAVSPQNLEEIT